MPINKTTFPAIFRWEPAALLQITGADALTFLQGQFTQELRHLPAAGAAYGLWLSVKGKVVADSFVLRGTSTEEFWVTSYRSTAAVIRARLEPFIIADDVVLEDRTADFVGVGLLGTRPLGWSDPEGLHFSGRRSRGPNEEWLVPRTERAATWAAWGKWAEVGTEALESQRISEGIPAIPTDLGPADLPNEGGLEADAISYTKGCYLGQEVMARLKSMGQVRRRLLRVRIAAGEPPVAPAPLFAGEKQVGELRSFARDPDGAGWIGLALVTLLHVRADARLALAAAGEPRISLLDAP